MAWGTIVSSNLVSASATEAFTTPISAKPREGVHFQILTPTSPGTAGTFSLYSSPYGYSSAPAGAFDAPASPLARFTVPTSASAFSIFMTGYRAYRVGGKTLGTNNDLAFFVRSINDGAGVSGNA